MTNFIWYEMARRKLQFHSDKQWYEINLWIPLIPSLVKKVNRTDCLLVCHGKEIKGIINWYRPTAIAWDTKIKPLIDLYTVEELTRLAGW